MKYIKYSFLLALVVGFSSCLKNSRDIGGLLSDKGSILTTISEKAYMNADAQNIGFGFDHTTANFNFTKRPTELVKFFTLKISQARETKLNGPLVIKVAITGISSIGNIGPVTPLPAGIITMKDITVPASNAALIVFPVFFTVNKASLDVGATYGVNFKLVSSNQGAISAGDGDINVAINYGDFNSATNTYNSSDISANYSYTNSVIDAANEFGIHNNRTAYLLEYDPNVVEYADLYYYGLTGAYIGNLTANVFSTGVSRTLFRPRFTLDGSGKVISVTQSPIKPPSAAVSALALDPTGVNAFVYSANNVRTLNVKYSFTYTSTINSVITARTVNVSEDFSYDPNQIYY
jgi:hypothetical protein